MLRKDTLYEIDRFRMIAALLIVAIHVSPLQGINETADFLLTRVMARVGVPFFLMITGYFVLAPCIRNNDTMNQTSERIRVRQSLCKLSKLYVVAILLYTPLNIYSGYFKDGFSMSQLMKDVVMNGTFYHLWYLPASIIGIVIIYVLANKISYYGLIILTTLLYMIGLLGDSYYGIVKQLPWLNQCYSSMFRLFDYTRNGLFYAPIFLMLGVVISVENAKICNNPIKRRKHWIVGGVISFVLVCTEAIILRKMNMQRHDSMYVFLIPFMYYIVMYLVNKSVSKTRDNTSNTTVEKEAVFYRKASLIIYIIHPMVIVLIRAVAKITHLKNIIVDNQLVLYLLVCISSFLIAYGIIFMKYRLKMKIEQKNADKGIHG